MSSLLTRRSILSAGTLTLAARRAWPQDSPVFSSDVKVVSVIAAVRTKDGDIVNNLTKDDFLLTEDNRPQSIKYFSRETNLPLILGLLIDTSGSQRNVLQEEVTASYRFLEKVLREEVDRTFLAHFDYDTELLQDLTSSKERLRKALDNMVVSNGSRNGAGGTTLYDAVYLAAAEVMKKQTGRKAVVILSDGVDHGSRMSLTEAIEHAQRADMLVYSIMFEGEENNGGGPFGPFAPQIEDGYRVLQKISRETGGGFFEVSRRMHIDAIYKRIEEELRSQYSIGYSPDRPPANSIYRAINLKTRRKNLVIQARKGYYPVPE